MPLYRLNSINPLTRRPMFFSEFEAEDDEAAVRAVHKLHGEPPMELWCGSRIVTHINSAPADHTLPLP